ncbi:lytic transglycosylase domain-containing protein [Chitinilyticum aquatile]|uniref:lytic transglycosylase domain-containing protein n=1 Tax=Chitinilyticum aquatile TaxID=362520 RepID=UPI00048B0F0C|nr:transglycosylase SLT domain-containing protein [Chitinilyticum aquatile]
MQRMRAGLLLCLLFSCVVAQAADEPQEAALAAATRLENSDPWQAAVRYCQLARQGVTEAQYRLGMLYAFGGGVDADRKVAATLFSAAAMQGHREAQNMLDTVAIAGETLPDCVTTGALPPRSKAYAVAGSPELDAILAGLPKNKRWVAGMVERMAGWYNVDPRLALSIATVESRFDPQVVSPANAMGVMQLIPETAERFNVKDAFNASQNIRGGVRYLRFLLDRFEGDVALVAAGYNAGEKAVERYRGVPPYKETQQYVKKVLHLYRSPMHRPDLHRWPGPPRSRIL